MVVFVFGCFWGGACVLGFGICSGCGVLLSVFVIVVFGWGFQGLLVWFVSVLWVWRLGRGLFLVLAWVRGWCFILLAGLLFRLGVFICCGLGCVVWVVCC